MSTYVLCLDSPLSGFPIWRAENWKTSHPPKGPLSPRSPFSADLSAAKRSQCFTKFQLWASVQATKISIPATGKASENCFCLWNHEQTWQWFIWSHGIVGSCHGDTGMSTNSLSGMHAYIQYSTVQYSTLHYIALHCITLNCSTLQYIHTNRLHLCISNRIQYNTLH